MSIAFSLTELLTLGNSNASGGSESPVNRLVYDLYTMKNTSTPLKRIKNFGPVTLPELESMGLTTLEQLRAIGWEDVCRRWVEYYPERLNANAFLGVIASIEGIVWTRATSEHRALARQLVVELRSEYRRPPVKKSVRKNKSK